MSMQLLTFKTPIGYNKAKHITECLRYFYFRNIAIGDFRPFLLPGS